MKFLLMMATEEGAWDALPADEQARIVEQHEKFTDELRSQGKHLWSHRLEDVPNARTVRKVSSGEIQVLDGPYAETKEVVGGIYVIEADSIEEAVEWARKSRFMPGSTEVRPIWQS